MKFYYFSTVQSSKTIRDLVYLIKKTISLILRFRLMEIVERGIQCWRNKYSHVSGTRIQYEIYIITERYSRYDIVNVQTYAVND